jgi:hypothetical protein
MSTRTISLRGKRRLVAGILAALGLALVAGLLAVIVLPATGRPAQASGSGPGGCFSNTGPVCTAKGGDADAFFGSVSSDGCIFSTAEIQPFQNLTRPGNVTNQAVFVAISVFDACNFVQLVEASNFDSTTQDLNFTGTIDFGDQVSTARVQGTATMFDFVSNTSFTATIDVTWQGYGPTTYAIDSLHSRAPGVIVNTHFKGAFRSAAASGTLSDGTTNFAATPTLDASLDNISTGTVQIFKS